MEHVNRPFPFNDSFPSRFEMLGHHCAAHPPQLESFERVMAQMLQDIQERLVFRYVELMISGCNWDGFGLLVL